MLIINYRVFWIYSEIKGGIELKLEDGSMAKMTTSDAGKLILWIDILKNEAPVYYWKTEESEGLAAGWDYLNDSKNHPLTRYKHDGTA